MMAASTTAPAAATPQAARPAPPLRRLLLASGGRRRRPVVAARAADAHPPPRAAAQTEPLSPLSTSPSSLTSTLADDDSATTVDETPPGVALMAWLERNGAPQPKIELCPVPDAAAAAFSAAAAGNAAAGSAAAASPSPSGGRRPMPAADVAVVACPLEAGELALSIPERLVLTLGSVVGSDDLAERLTSGKLSELSILSLVLAYEKKSGRKSRWQPFIRELDRQRARSAAAGGAESPLLWEPAETRRLLQGSPVVGAVEARLAGIRDEYDQLDTVWFMASALFGRYPFDMPSEALPLPIFLSAFCAVQAATVHLQGVAPSRRFALVPLGPPLLTYSSRCRAIMAFNPKNQCVELVTDRKYAAGQPLLAWCGPQPNARLLVNYGFVDEDNPHDRMPLVATLDARDPLFKQKRTALAAAGLGTMQQFDLRPAGAAAAGAAAAALGGAQTPAPPAPPPPTLPPTLLPWLRLAAAQTEEQVRSCRVYGPNEGAEASAAEEGAARADPALHSAARGLLARELAARLAGYARPLWRDLEILADGSASDPRERVAARLTKIERGILGAALEAVGGEEATLGGVGAVATAHQPTFKW